MTECLEEAHRATMMNERASALFGGLCRPAVAAVPASPGVAAVPAQAEEKLVVYGWDSYPVKTQKPGNHSDQRATWSTKIHGNCLTRLEACDLEGRPVFTFNLSSSISPRSTDEALAWFQLDLEARAGLHGGLTDMLVGLPGFCVVHIMDNGFRYIINEVFLVPANCQQFYSLGFEFFRTL